MQIDPGLDTGPMLLKYETPIGPDETAPELIARLAEAGGPLMAETLRKLSSSELIAVPQENSQATFAPLLKKNDGHIDWNLPAEQIYNRIRGLQPWPGAFTTFRGKNCQIWGKPLPPAEAQVPSWNAGRRNYTDDIRDCRHLRKRERAPLGIRAT